MVIPTYRRERSLREAIESIDCQTYPFIQVIVSDDDAQGSGKSAISNLETKTKIEYYRNSRRLGLPANRNRGIERANGELVMSLDDDAVLERDCIERLVRTYEALESAGCRIGAVGPAVVTERKRGETATLLDFAARSYVRTHGKPCVRDVFTGLAFMDFKPSSNQVLEVEELHSSSLYPRHVLSLVGGYEESLYKGNFMCEETDLHARIRRRGFGLYFEPKAVLRHRLVSVGGCRAQSLKYAYYYFRNQSLYSIRNNGVRSLYQIPSLVVFMIVAGLRGSLVYGFSIHNGGKED